MRYYVAADGSRWLGSTGNRPGQQAASAQSSRVPQGEAHAVPAGGQLTLCGLDIEDLAWFEDIDFAMASLLVKCRECQTPVSPS